MAESAKTHFITAYFDKWDRDVNRAAELLESGRFLLEGILTLTCYLGALAALRFPTLRDFEAYPKVVIEYSEARSFFEQVDLLLLYQWPRSKLRDHGHYKELKHHGEIVEALRKRYGSEDDVKEKARYASQADVIGQVLAAKIPGFDEQNLRDKLPLFSVAQILYRYLRCDAVHNADFPLLNESSDSNGNITYKPNHVITGDVLLKTTRAVIRNLSAECVGKSKWPQEL